MLIAIIYNQSVPICRIATPQIKKKRTEQVEYYG